MPRRLKNLRARLRLVVDRGLRFTLACVVGVYGLFATTTEQSSATDILLAETSRPGFAISLIPIGTGTLTYGQTIRFRISSERDGYAHLYSIDPQGHSRAWTENLPLHGGSSVDFPLAVDNLIMRAGPPAGDEKIILFVTEQAFKGFSGQKGGRLKLPVSLPIDGPQLERELGGAARRQPDQSWARTELILRIVE